EDGGGIGDVDPDGGLFGVRSADGFEDPIDEIAAPRGVDDQVRAEGLAPPLVVLETKGGDSAAIGRRNETLNPAMLADKDVGVLLYTLSHRQLDKRPGHGADNQVEIALRRVESGSFKAKIEARRHRHCAGDGEVLLKAGKELAERALAAGEES